MKRKGMRNRRFYSIDDAKEQGCKRTKQNTVTRALRKHSEERDLPISQQDTM